jgi:serine/threonine protein kinase
LIGTAIGHYKILSQLGAGGMGVVYEAEDTTLGRRVALKFVPEQFSQNPASLERFLREARSASALNHPNICTIYAAEQHDNTWMIAMELLEGCTLGQHISDGTLNTDRTLDIAIQVSDALDAAHGHGLVHRDIKPANIFVTKKGVVKVLDFGLAKLAVDRHAVAQTIGATAGDPDSYLTSPGMAVGTAAYMSPEQARGEDLDGRSDLFSFGAVLYEMATGKLPFGGATSAVIFAGILEREPIPPQEINPQMPAKLAEIICKSLEKDRDLRYQTAAELRGDFKRLRRDTTGRTNVSASASTAATAAFPASTSPSHRTPQPASTVTPTPSSTSVLIAEANRHRTGVIIALAIFLAILGAGGWTLYSQMHRAPARHAGQQMSIERLTNNGRVEGSANISPDGKYVVYQMRDNGKYSLWLRQIATSSAVKLVPDSDLNYGATTFSPDGNFVYYTWRPQSEPNGALYIVPTLGGTPHKILADISGPISFSPDGKQFAFIRESGKEGLSNILIANADGSIDRTLISRKIGDTWFGNFGVSWSNDGKLIATPVMAIDKDGYHETIGIVDMAGHFTTLIPKLSGQIGRLAWLNDATGLVYSANQRVGDFNRQIFMISYPAGEISRVTNDLNTYSSQSFGVTADNAALVTVQSTITSNLWLSDGNGANPKQLTQETLVGLNGFSTAGNKIAYTADIAGNRGIWLIDENGGTPTQISPSRDYTQSPAISPDGQHVAYMGMHDNKPNIWISDADGSNPHQLTFSNADLSPNFVDNQTIWFTHLEGGHINLHRVSISGGTPEKVSPLQTNNSLASWKGDRAIVSYFDEAKGIDRTGIMDTKDGKILSTFQLPDTAGSPAWMPGDKAISYLNTINSVTNLWKIDVDGTHPVQLTHSTDGIIFNYAWLPDGKFAAARGTYNSDAILIRSFR